MANRHYSNANPNYWKEGKVSHKKRLGNDDGREQGKDDGVKANFRETHNPNDKVKHLPKQKGAE